MIKNVHIHPITSPEIVKGEVLIVDGKIAGVGKKVSGRSAKVIDGRGLQLYPGMINAATNIGLDEIGSLRDSVDLDEIGEFNPQLMAQMAFNPTSIHISVTRASGITSVLSLPGTGGNRGAVNGQQTVFAGQGALMHLNGWTWEDMPAKPGAVLDMNFPEIRSPPQRGYLLPGAVQPKGFSALEKEYRKNLAEVGNFMEEARRYKKAKEAGNSDFKADPKLEAMIPVLNGRRRIFVRASTERAIKDAVAFADAHRVQIAIAAPGDWRRRAAAESAQHSRGAGEYTGPAATAGRSIRFQLYAAGPFLQGRSEDLFWNVRRSICAQSTLPSCGCGCVWIAI